MTDHDENGAPKAAVASKTDEILDAIRSARLSRHQLGRLESEIVRMKGETAAMCRKKGREEARKQ